MKTNLQKTVDCLNPGDLVCCSWCDASIGKSSGSGMDIDVPVKSWGIYVGLYGDRAKHIVLAQNSFRYSPDLFDLDYTAIPLVWTVEVLVIVKEHLPKDSSRSLVKSFIMGGHLGLHRPRISRNTLFQQRLSINGRPN